jgi:Pyruvate/2-oxoacid:ferredoxin oxidoreductase delta subunit
MIRRKIVEIDETKCDGCGRCVPACAEGAIRIVNGKAKLVADVYCDGLGACLGDCPRRAITIVERDAEPFDEASCPPPVRSGHVHSGNTITPACVCPGTAIRSPQLKVLPNAKLTTRPPATSEPNREALVHWPIQLHLVPVGAPFLHHADLLLVADCVPFACADFHRRILRSQPVVIGCPKLDDAAGYVEKLAAILVQSEIKSLSVVHMEVPCCTNLRRIAAEAMRRAGREIPTKDVTISISGDILQASEDEG